MKTITTMRQTVATMANQLRKLGYSLSNAFKVAWRRVKQNMTIRVIGTTYENRQELLQFIKNQDKSNLTVYLKRDYTNLYDQYAVAVVVGIKGIGYAHIGYVPKGLAQSLSKVIEKGILLETSIEVIGGYVNKANYGALLTISI